mgnify:CR=1 FL=1
MEFVLGALANALLASDCFFIEISAAIASKEKVRVIVKNIAESNRKGNLFIV